MKLSNTLLLLVLTVTTSHAWAYGSSSSSKKACAKPKFSEFIPANNAHVVAESALSFLASANTNPKSIAVTVKGQPVDVTVTDNNQGFLVTGKLPSTVTADFARINITADGPNQCKGNDGWLVKVE
ncbi:MAG: hypothetical protein PHR16_12690 [Methylovulum sp.]|nr:hypothetical protein [Methylovulum sp.]